MGPNYIILIDLLAYYIDEGMLYDHDEILGSSQKHWSLTNLGIDGNER